MTSHKDWMIDQAIRFLELDAEYMDARVKAGADPTNDELYKLCHMAGEERETYRRALADAILVLRPEATARVRKAVKFPLSSGEQMYIARMRQQPACGQGGSYD